MRRGELNHASAATCTVVLSLAAAMLSSCVTTGEKLKTGAYSGDTFHHEVETKVTRDETGLCTQRYLVARLRPGLHPNEVHFVRAWDHECDGEWNQIVLRDPREWNRLDVEKLTYWFYQITPVAEQARLR